MSESSKGQSDTFAQLFDTFFKKHWPVWVGGVTLGTLNIILFAIKSPWGASGGINNWGENIYGKLSLFDFQLAVPVTASLYGMLCLFLVFGSFSGALFSKEFALRIPPKGELVKGFLGGGLMAVGATFGLGCTIGSFFSGVPALSGGAIIFTVGLFAGTIVALKYLLWEMERYPKFSSGKSYTLLSESSKLGWQKKAGWMVIIVILAYAFYISFQNETMTWFILIGTLMGLICQRSRFCIVKAFRDPFMTGESDGSVGVMAGLIVCLFGFAAIKVFGIGTGAAPLRFIEMQWVFSHFWFRGLLGGFVFGLGMTIAGGCAVGTLWRVGEGQVKLWAAALGFILISPLSKKYLVPQLISLIPHNMAYKNFLPDYLGYWGAFSLVLLIILMWYAFVQWNERTGKFSAY